MAHRSVPIGGAGHGLALEFGYRPNRDSRSNGRGLGPSCPFAGPFCPETWSRMARTVATAFSPRIHRRRSRRWRRFGATAQRSLAARSTMFPRARLDRRCLTGVLSQCPEQPLSLSPDDKRRRFHTLPDVSAMFSIISALTAAMNLPDVIRPIAIRKSGRDRRRRPAASIDAAGTSGGGAPAFVVRPSRRPGAAAMGSRP